MAKFHVKAIALYGVAQVAEGVSAIQASPAGTITTTVGSKDVVGTGTSFTTYLAVGSYIYSGSAIVGRVASVTDNTHCALEDNVPASAVTLVQGSVMAIATAVTGAAFSTGLGPKNAIPVLNLNFSEEISTEAFQYSGDELSRDEVTITKDTYAKIDFESFLPVKGTTTSTPLVSEIPYADWFQSVGLAIVTSSGQYKITNSLASNKFMTIEVRRSSPDITTQKTFTITDARGTPDFDGMMGTKPKLKWNMQGNLVAETQKLYLVADFRSVKTDISPEIKSTTIGLSALDLYTSNNSVEPTASVTSNVCFDKLSAPNLVGWEYGRYQTGCGDGWSKGATPTDLTLTVLEDSADATYNPRDNISNNHLLTLKYGLESALSTADKRITFIAHKLMLANVTNSTVASYTGLDLKFRNVGTIDIIFS